MTIKSLAKLTHELNRSYCQTIGDMTQPIWECAPGWQRQSAIQGIEYALANPKVTPQQMHENWCQEKVKAGWKYGQVKHEFKKEHPCLVDYSRLPESQKVKDTLFLALVRAVEPYIEQANAKKA